jgi:hypothetical protein
VALLAVAAQRLDMLELVVFRKNLYGFGFH